MFNDTLPKLNDPNDNIYVKLIQLRYIRHRDAE